MTTYVQRCLTATAQFAGPARDLCAGITPGASGDGMFLTGGCSPSGALPATHFINEGMIEDYFAGLLPLTSVDIDGNTTTAPGQPETIVALAAKDGITVSLAQINAILNGVQVTLETPQQARDRKGLKPIQEAL
jgi:hypothetical protein